MGLFDFLKKGKRSAVDPGLPGEPEPERSPGSTRVVLASSSPRRKDLLDLTGIPFEVLLPEGDETQRKGEKVRAFVDRVSLQKALSVASKAPEAVVVGCDTVVTLGEEKILGKPRDKEEARKMLHAIGGREHTVLSAVAVVCAREQRRRTVRVETKVRMKRMENWEVNWYVGTGEPMDKAGAYALQGRGAMFVEGIMGSYTNVIGLPLMETVMLLRSFGIRI